MACTWIYPFSFAESPVGQKMLSVLEKGIIPCYLIERIKLSD